MILRPDIFVEDILNGDKIQQFSRRTVALQEICVKKGRKATYPLYKQEDQGPHLSPEQQ